MSKHPVGGWCDTCRCCHPAFAGGDPDAYPVLEFEEDFESLPSQGRAVGRVRLRPRTGTSA